jgi:hypothetical protein
MIEALEAIAHIDPTLRPAKKIMMYSRLMAEALRKMQPAPRQARINPGIPSPLGGVESAHPKNKRVIMAQDDAVR